MIWRAFEAAGLNGKLATHSLRKSFAQRLYEESGDIYLVQELLGHRNVSTTQKYIGINYASAREAVESMALRSERDRITVSLTSRRNHIIDKMWNGVSIKNLFFDILHEMHLKLQSL